MRPYPVSPLAVRLNFAETPVPELRAFYRRFVAAVPERILALAAEVRLEYPDWTADSSKQSFVDLDAWMKNHVATRRRTPHEVALIESDSPYPIDVPREDLTEATFSLASDCGIYLAQTLLKRHPHLHWDLPLGTKRFIDYGQPVLAGFGREVVMNPARIGETLCYTIASGQPPLGGIVKLLERWSENAVTLTGTGTDDRPK